jgi:hypothetical protein
MPGNVKSAAAASGFDGNMAALLKAAASNTALAYGKVAGMNSKVMAAVEAAVADSYITSFRLVYLVAIAFGCVAICLALISKPIDPAMLTNERAVRLENETRKEVVAA